VQIFDRIEVLNGWSDAPRYWWVYLLLPFRWEKCKALGWSSFSAFGFTFFWIHKLTPEEEKVVLANGKKMMDWVKKHGDRIR
jgi:hypothetical protein